jgi:Tfp pilus assembly protein FimT
LRQPIIAAIWGIFSSLHRRPGNLREWWRQSRLASNGNAISTTTTAARGGTGTSIDARPRQIRPSQPQGQAIAGNATEQRWAAESRRERKATKTHVNSDHSNHSNNNNIFIISSSSIIISNIRARRRRKVERPSVAQSHPNTRGAAIFALDSSTASPWRRRRRRRRRRNRRRGRQQSRPRHDEFTHCI